MNPYFPLPVSSDYVNDLSPTFPSWNPSYFYDPSSFWDPTTYSNYTNYYIPITPNSYLNLDASFSSTFIPTPTTSSTPSSSTFSPPLTTTTTTPPAPTNTPTVPTSYKCSNCSSTETCKWRNVRSKDGILCNACFIYKRKYKKDRSTNVAKIYEAREMNKKKGPKEMKRIQYK